MAIDVAMATRLEGWKILRYTKLRQGNVIHPTIHHREPFSPLEEANHPPRIPPIVKNRIPMVP